MDQEVARACVCGSLANKFASSLQDNGQPDRSERLHVVLGVYIGDAA